MAWTNVVITVTDHQTTKDLQIKFHDPPSGRQMLVQQPGFQTDAQIQRYCWFQQTSLEATDTITTKPGDVVDVSSLGPAPPTTLQQTEAAYNQARGWLLLAETDLRLTLIPKATFTAVTLQATNALRAWLAAGGKPYGPNIVVPPPAED